MELESNSYVTAPWLCLHIALTAVVTVLSWHEHKVRSSTLGASVASMVGNWPNICKAARVSLCSMSRLAKKLCGDMVVRTLNRGTRRRWKASFTLRPLYQSEEPSVPITMDGAWTPQQVSTLWTRNLLLLAIWPLILRLSSPRPCRRNIARHPKGSEQLSITTRDCIEKKYRVAVMLHVNTTRHVIYTTTWSTNIFTLIHVLLMMFVTSHVATLRLSLNEDGQIIDIYRTAEK
jgi:hypothetical protein